MHPLPSLLLPLFLLCAGTLPAQDVLTLEEALNWTLTNHPLARIADAVEQQGAATLLANRGAFDPKIVGEWDRKKYLSSTYFDYGDVGVEWQSPYAFKLAAGFQWEDGVFVNPERTLPSGGQSYLAVKLPLIQNLVTDGARLGIQRGNLAVERQRALADVVRNELRYDVTTRYAEWLYAERALEIILANAVLTEEYLDNTRQLFRLGDKPGVDTLEASVYLNQQLLDVEQARVDLQLAKLAFAELYWPLEITTEPTLISPDLLLLPEVSEWQVNQPELRDLQLSIADLQLQQRLKRQYLLPKLEVGYYLLGDGGLNLPAEGDQYGGPLDRAYKIEAKASYPILNRRARGEVQLGELKILETEAKLEAKQQSLEVKVQAYTQAVENYSRQLLRADLLIRQSLQLLEAEQALFNLGESTQFLLNARRQSYQKALLVAEKLRFSRNKAIFTFRYLVSGWQ